MEPSSSGGHLCHRERSAGTLSSAQDRTDIVIRDDAAAGAVSSAVGDMKHLLIIHSGQSGHTQAMCDAVVAGATADAEIETRCLYAPDAGLDDLLWAHALLLGTPENFGYMSGLLKDFFDRTYYPAEGKTLGLPYALFISAGNDGTGAVRAIERIATGYGWRAVAEPLILKGDIDGVGLTQCRELGEAVAAGLAAGIF